MRFYQSPSLRSWPRWGNGFLFRRLLLAAFSILAPLYSSELSAQRLIEQVVDKTSQSGDANEERQCVWVAAWASASEKNCDNDLLCLKSIQRKFDYTTKRAVPGCFGNMWKKLCLGEARDGKRVGVVRERDGAVERYGWCQVPRRTRNRGEGSIDSTLAGFLGVPAGDPTANLGRTGFTFMDSQCRYVESAASAKLCGFAGVSVSPLSLILDESVSLESDMTVVDLALDHNRPGSYSLWKGSDKAPLLVYDPERSGNVASATKLFGNYTFGGRTAELSRVKLDSRAERPTWSNGYEALALLDKDHDGRVAGAELEPLSLWFDRNRNAQSEAGEVKALSSVGITALYYQNPTGQAGSDDIGLDVGYERDVDGRVIQGRSVDWYGETFSSKVEAAQALAAIISARADRARLDLERDWRSDPLAFSPRATKNHSTNLSGFWRWHMVDDENSSNPGAFAFDQADDLSVRGFSIIESVLQKNEQDLHSGVTILPAEGKLETDTEGRRTLKLTVTNPENGSTAETTATLEENGYVLKGTTVQKYISSNDSNAKSATLRYEWVAQKFVDKGAVR